MRELRTEVQGLIDRQERECIAAREVVKGSLGGSVRGSLGGSVRGSLGGSVRGSLGGSVRGSLGGFCKTQPLSNLLLAGHETAHLMSKESGRCSIGMFFCF